MKAAFLSDNTFVRASKHGQKGFSLIEVSMVTAIILLIAVIGIPSIGSYVMENKVPKVGQELARFVMHARVNASASGGASYDGISTDNLAAMVADSTVLNVTSDGEVHHGLGAGGLVEVEEADSGAAFVVRLTQVSNVACPSIASVLQRVADRITVGANGNSGQTVKDETMAYNALSTESLCAKGDVNQFEFHVS